MSRIRSVHPGLYTDEAFVALTMVARVFLPGLWTESDDHGVFEWKPLTLKMKIFPADNVDVNALLAELENADIIRRFMHDGKEYGVARNFCKWQRPKEPRYKHPLPPELRDYIGLKPETSEALGKALPNGGEMSPQREEGGGKKEEEGKKKEDIRTVAKATRPDRDEKFEEFWKLYPKRKGANPKKPARDQWDAALKRGSSEDQIIAAVKAGAGFDREKIGTEYIPQAVKWLRDRRFDDHEAAIGAESISTIFIPVESPQWGGLAARWREIKRKNTGPPARENGGQSGWYFPREWIAA